MISQHETQRARTTVRAHPLDRPADERVGQLVDPEYLAPREHDRVVELAVDDLAVRRDRRERADVAVHDARALADDRRTADPGAHDLSPGLDHHVALDRR